MGFIDYTKSRWCTKCGEKRSITLIFCPMCGMRVRYKRRMHHTIARELRLQRHKLPAWNHISVTVGIRSISFTASILELPTTLSEWLNSVVSVWRVGISNGLSEIMVYVCPAPDCRKVGCFRHCNSCGKDIFWRPPLLDKEIAYNGPRPLNSNGSLHRCMLQGTKQYKRITGDKIIDSINTSKELYDFLKQIHWSRPLLPYTQRRW
jgi:hypothetical protein